MLASRPDTRIKITLAENKLLLRTALSSLLKSYGLFEITAEVANGKELLEVLKQQEMDVVIMDIELSLISGIEALKIIRLRFPAVKVIILSVYENLHYVKEAMTLGARGYLTKNCTAEQLVKAIMAVYEKGSYIEESLVNHLAHESIYGSGQPVPLKSNLSNREKEVLEALCKGKTEKEIAKLLNISVHTVHFHRMNLYVKTQSHNLADLLRYARDNGL